MNYYKLLVANFLSFAYLQYSKTSRTSIFISQLIDQHSWKNLDL